MSAALDDARPNPPDDAALIQHLNERGYTVHSSSAGTIQSVKPPAWLRRKLAWLTFLHRKPTAMDIFETWLICGSLCIYGFAIFFFAQLVHYALFDDPDKWSLSGWHGIVSILIVMLVAGPFLLIVGFCKFEPHLTAALSNPNSVSGYVLRQQGFAPPVEPPPAPTLEKGRSQFATLSSVQQNGIWRP